MKKGHSISINEIINTYDKEYDNALYSVAKNLRKTIADELYSENDHAWEDIDPSGGMFDALIERAPFDDVKNVLSFNIFITRKACERVLNDNSYSDIDKVAIYAFVIEIGAREFINPDDTNKILKNLSASKDSGFFFTPPSVALRMIQKSMEYCPDARSTFDPAAGAGIFLAYQIILNDSLERIVGVEIDQGTSGLAIDLLKYIISKRKRKIDFEFSSRDFFDFFEERKGVFKTDLIVMNPPYGSVKFLASDLTDQSTRAGMVSDDRFALGEKIRKEKMDLSSRLRKQFQPYGMGKGTLELSKLFTAASIELLSDKGVAISITPSAWLGDDTSTNFRQKIIKDGLLHEVWLIPEVAKLFKGVNQPTLVSVLRRKATENIKFSYPVLAIGDVEKTSCILDISSVLKVAGDKMKFPKCDTDGLHILLKLQQLPTFGDVVGLANSRGELDLTAYKEYVSSEDTGHRLIRGDHIDEYRLVDSSESDKDGFVHYEDFIDRISQSSKRKYVGKNRIAIPQCSYLQKKNRIEAALIPEGTVVANSCNFLALEDNDRLEELFYYFIVINSSIVEWKFRIFSYNNHVANSELDVLPCVPYYELTNEQKSDIRKMYDGLDELNIYEADAYVAHIMGISIHDYDFILNSLKREDIERYMRAFSGRKEETITRHDMPSLSELDKVMISYVEPGGNWTSIPETVPSKRLDQIREMARTRGMVRTTYYSRLKYTQPAYTISTYFNRPGNGANIHPWEDRTLTCREAARLQSFPDSFVFEGNDAAVRTQIGNAVPPLLGYAIGLSLRKKLGDTIQFCDIFAGAGGLSYGMELAGFEGVAALEINPSAAATYKRNHNPNIKTIVGDINDKEIQSELINAVEQGINKDKPWILVGGPPCQGFSTAGYRNEDDIRNKLVDSYIEVVKRLNPTVVIMENVPGILSMQKGAVISGVYSALHALGYKTHSEPWVVDAERYGVPQMRRRVIIIGVKEERFLPDYPQTHFQKCLGRREQEEEQMSFSTESYPITVGEAFLGLPSIMDKNQYYPADAVIDDTYSRWCSGMISTDEFFKKRG